MYGPELWCDADIDSKHLKKFRKLYVSGRRLYLASSQQLAAGTYDEPSEHSPHLHTPIIRGALIFSFHPILVVDIPLRHCGQDLYTCLLPSLRMLHASPITATFIWYLNNMRWEVQFMKLTLLQLSSSLISSATEIDVLGELESLSWSRYCLPVRNANGYCIGDTDF